MKTKSKLLVAIAAGFIISNGLNPAYCAEDISLSLNFKVGDKYLCSSEINQTVTQTIDDEKQTMQLNLAMEQGEDVIAIDSLGNIEIEITYERIKVNQSFGAISSEYDSDNPPDYIEPGMKGFDYMVGKKIIVGLSPLGKVVWMDGAAELVDSMIAVMDIPESPQRESVISDIKGRFGADALTQSLEQVYCYIPDRAVKVGDSWRNESNLNFGFGMKISSNYNLISSNGLTCIISDSSTVMSLPELSRITFGEITTDYQISGDRHGTIEIDLESGRPIDAEIHFGFSGTMTVSSKIFDKPQTWPIEAEGITRTRHTRR